MFPTPRTKQGNVNNSLDIHLTGTNMDFPGFLSCVGHFIQSSGQAMKDVGCGAATFIHNVADETETKAREVTEAGLDLTHGAANVIKDIGESVGIPVIPDIVENSVRIGGEIAAGAVNIGVGLPVGATKGAMEIASFIVTGSSDAVTGAGCTVSAGARLAADIEEIKQKAPKVLDCLWNIWASVCVIWERMRRFSLPLGMAIGMVILLLGMYAMVGIKDHLIQILTSVSALHLTSAVAISFLVVVSAIIAYVEVCLYLS
jgi:hypothetical protein